MASVNLLPRFDLAVPQSLREALALLGEAGKQAQLLAGGTDLMVKMKQGLVAPRLVISLARIMRRDHIEATAEGGLRIGALATMARLAHSHPLAASFRGVAEGAASIGGPLIRNRATVGGNIINARPCADTVPPLVAAGALLHLESSKGERAVELDGFITAPGQTQIGEAEILTAIEIPPPATSRTAGCYIKITRRAAMEITLVGCGAHVTLNEDATRIERARVVLASVAPTPIRITEIEGVLEGEKPTEKLVAAAADKAMHTVAPIDDHRAPALFRRNVVRTITARALFAALERAGRRLS